jgi:GLPGLI family protein
MIRILFILFSIVTIAQQKTNKGLIYYSCIESLGMGSKNGPEIMSYLLFNQNESNYVTQKDSLYSLHPSTLKAIYENTENGTSIINPNIYTTKRGFEVYTSLKKDSVWSSYKWKDYAFVKEEKQNLKWQLINEKKKIGTFECHKAIGEFRGRQYIAWYTNEIPIPFGPWKLQGLPGLILEAYTPNEEIYFIARKIEFPTNNNNSISPIKIDAEKKWITFKEYLKWSDENLEYAYQKGVLLGINAIRATREQTFKEFKE